MPATGSGSVPRRRTLLVGIALVAITLGVYGRVVGLRYVGIDDAAYVTQNPRVQEGLTSEGLRWAFTTTHQANWHPLTWLSHMLDVELFGPGPAGPHAVNAILHALTRCCCSCGSTARLARRGRALLWRRCSHCTRSRSSRWRGSPSGRTS